MYQMNASAVEPLNQFLHSSPHHSQTCLYRRDLRAVGDCCFGYDTGGISGCASFSSSGVSDCPSFQQDLPSVRYYSRRCLRHYRRQLSDRFGRKEDLAHHFGHPYPRRIVCAFAGSIQILILGRVMVGIGIGCQFRPFLFYIAEISPASARGWQVSLFQLAITSEPSCLLGGLRIHPIQRLAMDAGSCRGSGRACSVRVCSFFLKPRAFLPVMATSISPAQY